MKALYPSRKVWTHTFISKIFIIEIQTISYIKDLNNFIKYVILINNILYNLTNISDTRLEHETEYNYFFEYKILASCIKIMLISHDLFSKINK